MAKAKAKKRGNKAETSDTGPRCISRLAPELIRMILQFTDKATLRACSRAARKLRYDAQCLLGRHLTINTSSRVKECAQLVTRGAFQHIRSLDLGIDSGELILKADWKYYVIILAAFAKHRALSRLWLSELPFDLLQSNQKRKLRETVTVLGSMVTELGLYRCCFSSSEEMISLVRSFPLCDSLFLVDCVTQGGPAVGNAFAGLPAHRLRIKDLQLSSTSFRATTSSRLVRPHRPTLWSDATRLIDVSNLIEDAALDVGSLTALVCDVWGSESTRRIARAVSGSSVEQFQVACTEPGGFQAFMDHFSKWTLTSLTIGPQLRETNTQFWEEAFNGLPPLPSVENITIVYNYRPGAFNTDCWEYFDSIVTRQDMFPALASVQVQTRAMPSNSIFSYLIPLEDHRMDIYHSLRRIRKRRLLTTIGG